MSLIVAASIALTSCDGSKEEEEQEEEEMGSMPAWCNIGGSHYHEGARVCLNGAMQECAADGKWKKLETECK